MDEFRYHLSRQSWNDAPMRIWNQEDIKERIPIIDMEGANVGCELTFIYNKSHQWKDFLQVLGGLFTPGDGHIDPYSLTMAIAAGARRRGALLFQNTEVRDLEPRADGGWNISTDRGLVKADRVVNASGTS